MLFSAHSVLGTGVKGGVGWRGEGVYVAATFQGSRKTRAFDAEPGYLKNVSATTIS